MKVKGDFRRPRETFEGQWRLSKANGDFESPRETYEGTSEVLIEKPGISSGPDRQDNAGSLHNPASRLF